MSFFVAHSHNDEPLLFLAKASHGFLVDPLCVLLSKDIKKEQLYIKYCKYKKYTFWFKQSSVLYTILTAM